MDGLRAIPPGNQRQKAKSDEQDVSACSALLVQALEYLIAGQHAEGVTLLLQAQAELPPALMHLAPMIQAITRGQRERNQAQEELLAASRHFATVESEQQTRFLRLEHLLLQQEREEPARAPIQSITRLHAVPGKPGQQRAEPEAAQGEGPAPARLFIQQKPREDEQLPPLYIICFGRFQVLRDSQPLTLCQNRNGQAILRYLVAQANQRATIDALMETFWPDDGPETARRKLQVAVSALRRTLNQGYDCGPGGGYILCKEQYYHINPSLSVTSDVAEFLALYERGRRSEPQAALQYYEQACRLYSGACFVEDIYSNWSCRRREQCSSAHATMCQFLAEAALTIQNYDEAIHRANLMLAENRCDETAYRLLMQVYAAQGRRSEVIRQYQRCEQELQEELGIAPMSETTQLFHALLTNNSSEHRAFFERK